MQPICIDCAHFARESEGWKCAAFPNGIPDSIIGCEADHTKPIDGDHGIQFEHRGGLDDDDDSPA